MSTALIVLGVTIWLCMGYFSWRAMTKTEEYYRITHFLFLLFCLTTIAPIVFALCLGEGLFDEFDLVVCKRWLSKSETLELVKQKLNGTKP